MRMRMWIGAAMGVALMLSLATAVRAEGAGTDAVGKVTSMLVSGQPFDLRVGFAVHAAGWKSAVSPNAWDEHGARMHKEADGWTWTGQLAAGGTRFDWNEQLTDLPGGAKLAYRFVPEAKPAIAGVFVTKGNAVSKATALLSGSSDQFTGFATVPSSEIRINCPG